MDMGRASGGQRRCAAGPERVPDYVRLAQAGDPQAFRGLYERHRADVAAVVSRISGPQLEVEDTVQEVFLQVYRSLSNYRGEARFTTWLFRVTMNVALMQRRAARSRPGPVPHAATEIVAPESDLPEAGAERHERLRAFGRILAGLGAEKRSIFVRHVLQGVPAVQVARASGIPVLTLRTRLFYARRELYGRMVEDPVLRTLVADLRDRRPAASASAS
jgi:RNA polymerase sigma-70 factor (ECF subfamily)